MLVFLKNSTFAQGSTTSGINGKVSSNNAEVLPGANIQAIHIPTGTKYVTTSDAKGFFHLPNMNVGGPYKIIVSYIGFDNYVLDNVFLTLGQTFEIKVNMSEKSTTVSEVTITAKGKDLFDGNTTGYETSINNLTVVSVPSISRSLTDYTRLTPMVKNYGGGLTVAGINNRYNSIFIDGAVNNDVFGLASSGTNGGQLGISPISIDAIEQFQVVIAPYDVR